MVKILPDIFLINLIFTLKVTAGFLLNIIAVLVLVFGTETWGDAIFGFHTLPDGFRVAVNQSLSTNLTDILTTTATSSI